MKPLKKRHVKPDKKTGSQPRTRVKTAAAFVLTKVQRFGNSLFVPIQAHVVCTRCGTCRLRGRGDRLLGRRYQIPLDRRMNQRLWRLC